MEEIALISFNLNESTRVIRHYAKWTGIGMAACGVELMWVKANSEHGEWLEWLNRDLNWQERTVQRFITVGKEFLKQQGVKQIQKSVLIKWRETLASNTTLATDFNLRFDPWGHKPKQLTEGGIPIIPEGKWNVIYADPPWEYDFSKSESRSIPAHYDPLCLEDIKYYTDANDRPIQDAIADDAILFIWATQPKLREALEVIVAWGFEYKTGAVWKKDKIGMGYYFRGQHELLFVANKGNMPIPDPENRVSSVIEAPRLQHSRKPAEVRGIIKKMYPNCKYMEAFRTETIDGWEGFGK